MSARLFIAAELPVLHRDWLDNVVRDVQSKEKLPALRWQKRDQWHITLKFLGECAEDKFASISEGLKETAQRSKPFRLSLGKLRSFRGSHGGILYIDVENGRDELTALADHLHDRLAAIGFKKEARQFRAHVTLARTKHAKPISLKDVPPFSPSPEAYMDQLTLYQSHLSASGSRYVPLTSITLVS